MLRFFRLVAITGTVVQMVLPAIALQVSAQETADDNATCYLRIEGRSTQDVSRLCGKTNQPSTKPTPHTPTRPSAQPLSSAVDPDSDSDDDAPTTIPTRRSPIPSTPVPSTPVPSTPARSPATVTPKNPSPTSLPNSVAPDQTPNSDPGLLPVPKLPETLTPQPAKRKVATKPKTRSQPQQTVQR